MRTLVITAIVLFAAPAWADSGDPPRAVLQVERGSSPHAGIPFNLLLGGLGFDESPPPEQPKLDIEGAVVTAMGGRPNISQSMTIVGNQRQVTRSVTWVYTYRVEVPKDGRIRVPAVTLVQGSKRATAQGIAIDVDAVPTSDEMKVELQMPERAIYVGETVEAKLVWLFRRQPEDQSFTIPIASSDAFTVTAPPVTDKRRAVEIDVGQKKLALPYTADEVDVGGQKWTRIALRLRVEPRVAGKVQLPPAVVTAAFAVTQPDSFGQVGTKLFKTTDSTRTLDVKPLPETDKPAVFAGAVGSQFAISARTSRSVVQLGEPVELDITIKSDQRLDNLSLGKLDVEGGLPKDKFTVPAEAPTGELADDGKTKTFKVTAQVIGPASEIPALAFAYFDPTKSAYQIVHSDPIALSVKGGGTVVGAADVVSAVATKRATGSAAQQQETDVALIGADLALSAPGEDHQPLGGTLLWLLVALLYAIPLGVFAARSWQLRTRGQREDAAEVRAARKQLDDVLARAEKAPARDTAGSLVAALRGLARALERDVEDRDLIARIETESFAPSASSSPLAAELRTRAAELAQRWIRDARRTPAKKASGAALVLIAASLVAARATAAPNEPAPAPPAAPTALPAVTPVDTPKPLDLSPAPPAAPTRATSANVLADGRALYQQAMTLTDATARKAAFARAAIDLGEAARAAPDQPELLADWGNAALGAGDVGTATLAYRRALAIDGSNVRARRNLSFLRSRQSDSLRPPSQGDSLFFFHAWPRARRLVVGAVAFAACLLLLVPWTGKRRRGLALVALLPAAVWVAMLVSIAMEDRHPDDGVVMDAAVLRAADSAGAPAAAAAPLPRGTEVTIIERRDAWTKVRTAGGTAGWVPDGSVERVISTSTH
jgi:tetratricopeptide (TPR) repeat protein